MLITTSTILLFSYEGCHPKITPTSSTFINDHHEPSSTVINRHQPSPTVTNPISCHLLNSRPSRKGGVLTFQNGWNLLKPMDWNKSCNQEILVWVTEYVVPMLLRQSSPKKSIIEQSCSQFRKDTVCGELKLNHFQNTPMFVSKHVWIQNSVWKRIKNWNHVLQMDPLFLTLRSTLDDSRMISIFRGCEPWLKNGRQEGRSNIGPFIRTL